MRKHIYLVLYSVFIFLSGAAFHKIYLQPRNKVEKVYVQVDDKLSSDLFLEASLKFDDCVEQYNDLVDRANEKVESLESKITMLEYDIENFHQKIRDDEAFADFTKEDFYYEDEKDGEK